MAKKKVLINKSELVALVENIVDFMEGKIETIKPLKSNINESTISNKKIIKLNESDIKGLVNKVIKRR